MATLWQNASSSWPLASEQTVNQIGAARVRSHKTSVRKGSSQTGVSTSTVNSPPGKTELRILPISATAGSYRKAQDEQGVLPVRNAIIHSTKLYTWYVPYRYGEVFIGTHLYKTMCSSGVASIFPPVWNSSAHTKRVRFLYFFEDKGVRFGCHCTKHHF